MSSSKFTGLSTSDMNNKAKPPAAPNRSVVIVAPPGSVAIGVQLSLFAHFSMSNMRSPVKGLRHPRNVPL